MSIADKATPPLKKNAESVPPSPRALKLQPIHRGSGEVMIEMATVVTRLTAAIVMKNDEGICLNLFANDFITILYHKKSQVFTWDFRDRRLRLLRALFDDLLRHVWWYFLVLRQFHGAGCAALRHRANVASVAKHVSQRHKGLD